MVAFVWIGWGCGSRAVYVNDFELFVAGEPPEEFPLATIDGVDGDSIEMGIRVSSYNMKLLLDALSFTIDPLKRSYEKDSIARA